MKDEPTAKIICLDINKEETRLRFELNEKQNSNPNYGYKKNVFLEQVHDICHQTLTILNQASRTNIAEKKQELMAQLKKIGELLRIQLFPDDICEKLKRFQQQGIEYLQLSIDDQLAYIPWELIVVNDEFLKDMFCIGRTVIKTCKKTQKTSHRNIKQPLSMLLISHFGRDLPQSAAEGKKICNLIDQNNKNGCLIDASRQSRITHKAFITNFTHYDIIHFAGHVEYHSDHPDKSGLKLLDMPFTSRDIPTPSKKKPMPAFFFLNACQSGRIADWKTHEEALEKSFGFAHTLMLSGVQHILGTFWEIRDEPGSLFAIEFYKLFLEGVAVGKAVKQAKNHCRQKYGEDPCWESYVLFGDPTVQYISKRPQTRITEQNPQSFPDDSDTHITIPEKKLKMIILLLVLIAMLLVTGIMIHTNRHSDTNSNVLIFNTDAHILEILKKIKEKDQKKIQKLIYQIESRLPQKLSETVPEDQWTSRPLTLVVDYDSLFDALHPGKLNMIFSVINNTIIHKTSFTALEGKHLDKILMEQLKRLTKVSGSKFKDNPQLMVPRFFLFVSLYHDDDHNYVFLRLSDECAKTHFDWYEKLDPDKNIHDQCETISFQLIDNLIKLKKSYPLQGVVKDVESSKIIINIGKMEGVEPGQMFKCLETNVLFEIFVVREYTSVANIQSNINKFIKKGQKIVSAD
jgi:CHAT domain-containing protein